MAGGARLRAGRGRGDDQLGRRDQRNSDRDRHGATATTVNSLYTVAAGHTYAKPGVYKAAVSVSAAGTAPVTANFTVTVP